MTKRKIIKIDLKKCNGCGVCIPNCPEGAIQVIDGKARLVSDLFCDGLGACIGHCPKEAITIIERDAEPYSELKVMENIVKQGDNTIKAHLRHLKDHGEEGYLEDALDYLKAKGINISLDEQRGNLPCGCPGTNVVDRRSTRPASQPAGVKNREGDMVSELAQWPVQLKLVPPDAPYLNGADLLIAADCVPFAFADFHNKFLKGRTLLVGCPKLDDIVRYEEKLALIFSQADVKSITYVHMEVPCCSGFIGAIERALAKSGKRVPFVDITISIGGEIIS